MNMLHLVMRLKLVIKGEPRFYDSTQLGRSYVSVFWPDVDGQFYFMHGNWIVQGWHHVMTKEKWETRVYISRLDWNAAAKVIDV
jgi:hypothetical protein